MTHRPTISPAPLPVGAGEVGAGPQSAAAQLEPIPQPVAADRIDTGLRSVGGLRLRTNGWLTAIAAGSTLLIALPLVALGSRADWPSVAAAITAPPARQALWLSLRTALTATAAALVLGLPLAVVLARHRSRWVGLLRAVVLLPLVLPPMVSGIALLFLLGRRGLIGSALARLGVTFPFTTTAVVIAQTFVAMPFLVIALEGALVRHGNDYEAIAATLGARPGRILVTVTLPLIAPALRSGLLLCFARALGEFGATALFAGNAAGTTRTMPLAIYTAFNGAGVGQDTAIALSLLLVAVAIVIMVASGDWRRPGQRAAVSA